MTQLERDILDTLSKLTEENRAKAIKKLTELSGANDIPPTNHNKGELHMTETVYEHCSGDKTFTVTAAERWSVAMCKRLKEKYPDQVDIDYVNKDGSMVVHFPADWMKIVPKIKKELTEEEKAKRIERLKPYRFANAQDTPEENTPIFAETV